MGLIRRNPFGHILFIKNLLIKTMGVISHRRYRGFNSLQIEGSEIIRNLPETGVLFVSNHQTYFADVAAMLHVFNASLKGRKDTIKGVFRYLARPKLNIYFVAAKETMSSGIIPRIFAYAGAITVQRTWREAGKDIQRPVNPTDSDQIGVALNDGWVITFPQGTTKPFRPIRKGTAHIIKEYKPIVIPIVIDGFRRSFDKKGLLIKKRGILQSMVIKEPLKIDYENESVDEIVEKISYAIEQHTSFMQLIPKEILEAEKKLDELRNFWEY
ncbi:MAG: 1-acyl-sn-glycerol-3-phosphate acyltransferase [Bacteroidales bacterium]|nr:1-acyl-sn-glycerol-3-phosphate acyltransferase [Bacteroidales bacterium]MBN2757256.1 1-acyl-sn-glycerol-3-phosphate acyltransferase [Bacteroidales bacterium]